ncbi:DNA polymerase III subunit gamma/tau [Shewanella sp. WXL01]|uniref:DNA polymerase III subunit gamma/tau n=1 Tax=Shewanella sp. WXL01 TaxID=2709721 RepID=UPI0014385CC3|nr:DNA polymerase III subunit gamma/tau [Shewanella sp. WXL01]NKF52401.1 DNA polymerase III subunit gamma/tau [Shewanella sp. WXL01]
MSYQVLARKWRPATFEQMVGQSHVLMALTNALTQQRLHHAYLFTGTRGVGKTSLARLFAKGLNCELGVSATPCGQCASCVEIAEGRFVDLIEVDAASRTKVDDTRELLDNVQYRPTRGRYKVYLIDEVHMLSKSSFNALLKTLEEPPEHVKFLLATTDPHKLPVTVLSRCLQFNLKSLSQDEIANQLNFVLGQEQIAFDDAALNLLAKAANGSMRDALSLTDQAIAFSSGQVLIEQVRSMLGSIDEQHVIALLKALCDAEIGPLMQCLHRILAFGADADEVLRSLLELLHQITLTQFAPAAAQQSLYSEQIINFAQQISAEQIQLYYQLLLSGRKDLPHAPDPKSGLEMALLRAVAFVPEKSTQRWVVQNQAQVDLEAKPISEVVETSPKPASEQSSEATEADSLESNLADKAEVEEPVASQEPVVSQETVVSQDAVSASSQNQEQVSSQDVNEQALPPEKPTVSEQPKLAEPASENDASEAEDDQQALNAEQAILLSQAQSLGFEVTTLGNEDKSLASDEPWKQAETQTDVSQSQVDEAANHSDTSAAQLETREDAQSEPEQLHTAQVEAVQAADTQVANSDTQASASLQTNTSNEVSADDAYHMAMAEMSEQMADDDYQFGLMSDSGELATETQIGNSAEISHNAKISELTLEQAPEQTVASQPSVISEAVTSNEDDDLDDMLDAVLNSRAELVADLEALAIEQKNNQANEAAAAKKSAKEKSAKPVEPKQADSVTASANADTYNDTSSDVESSDVANYEANRSETGNSKIGNSEISSAEASQFNAPDAVKSEDSSEAPTSYTSSEDRPPWVEPSPEELAAENQAASLVEQTLVEQPLVKQPLVEASQQAQSTEALTQQSQAPSTQAQTAQMQATQVQVTGQQSSAAHPQSTAQVDDASIGHSNANANGHQITGDERDLQWYRVMSQVKAGGRVRQLGVNSICHGLTSPLKLTLKPDQKHLAAPAAISQLEAALTDYLEQETRVEIEVGAVQGHETPLELRKRFHQELTAGATQSLLNDDSVQWMIQTLGAQLNQDSVLYPTEQLSQIGNLIPAKH